MYMISKLFFHTLSVRFPLLLRSKHDHAQSTVLAIRLCTLDLHSEYKKRAR